MSRPAIIDHLIEQGIITADQADKAATEIVTPELKEVANLICTLGRLPDNSNGIEEAKYFCLKLNLSQEEAKKVILSANKRVKRLEHGEQEAINFILNGWNPITLETAEESQEPQDDDPLDTSRPQDESSQMLFDFDLEENSSSHEEPSS